MRGLPLFLGLHCIPDQGPAHHADSGADEGARACMTGRAADERPRPRPDGAAGERAPLASAQRRGAADKKHHENENPHGSDYPVLLFSVLHGVLLCGVRLDQADVPFQHRTAPGS